MKGSSSQILRMERGEQKKLAAITLTIRIVKRESEIETEGKKNRGRLSKRRGQREYYIALPQ